MNRKSVMRKRRKEIMRLGSDYNEEVLKEGLEGELLPRKEWGYCVSVTVNGYRITSPDRNRFESIYAAWNAAKWCHTQPFPPQTFDDIKEEVTVYEHSYDD